MRAYLGAPSDIDQAPISTKLRNYSEGSRIRLPLVTGLLEGTSKVLIEELPVPVENCKKKFWSKKDLFNTELTKPVAASVLFLSHQKTFFIHSCSCCC